MLDVEKIKSEIGNKFKEMTIVNEGILRCTREHAGNDISYYYIDYTENEFSDGVNLKEFQDNFLGEDYFANSGSIQWNYYLLFVYKKENYEKLFKVKRDLISSIEANKQYTRKFILPITDVASFFDFNFFRPDQESEPEFDIATKWTERLVAGGLGEIANRSSTKSRAQIVSNYLSEIDVAAPVENVTRDLSLNTLGKCIAEIKLDVYRNYPQIKNYNFGKMNLLVGPNGVGKTSLLEAIELCYCGATFRANGEVEKNAKIKFRHRGETSFISYDPNDNKKYQQRDLVWYGKSVMRGNELYSNFNKYNFFNADSAFKLSNDKSNDDIDSAFSSLALGENANVLEKKLNDYLSDFKKEKSVRTNIVKNLQIELDDERVRLTSLTNVELASANVYALFVSLMERSSVLDKPPASFAAFSEEIASRYLALSAAMSRLISTGAWLQPLSLKNIENFLKQSSLIKKDLVEVNNRILDSRGKIQQITNKKVDLQRRENKLNRLLVYVENKNFERFKMAISEVSLLTLEAKIINDIKDRFHFFVFDRLNELNLALDPLENLLVIEEECRLKRDSLNFLMSELTQKKELFGKVQQLSIEVKHLSRQILQLKPELENCPACNQFYQRKEIEEIFKQAAGDTQQADYSGLENRALLLRTEIESLEGIRSELKAAIEIIKLIIKAGLANEVRLGDLRLLRELAEKRAVAIETSEKNYREIIGELTNLGFSDQEFHSLALDLEIDKQILSEDIVRNWISINLSKLKSEFDQEKLILENVQIDEGKRINELKKLNDLLGGSSVEDFSEIDIRVQKAMQLQTEIHYIKANLAFEEDSDFNLMFASYQECIQVMKDYISTSATEKVNLQQLEVSKLKIKDYEKKLAVESKLLARASDAYNLFTDLILNNGKEQALTRFIERNRKLINKVFNRIHSPHEFSGLAPGKVKLIRLDGNVETSLLQVSTGQRAALAISIFLALNLSLKNAPPVILIDDPVAHIDDLNTLSFLDFLREIAINTNRQIFFATASQKLASLVEKKFAFLGEEDFKRYDLSR